jgi:hypothetical protein
MRRRRALAKGRFGEIHFSETRRNRGQNEKFRSPAKIGAGIRARRRPDFEITT